MKQVKSNTITKQFAKYAIPSVAGMVVSSLYTVIDGIFVGMGVGDVALGAVNIVFPFIIFQIAITMLLAIGGANMVSIHMGKKDKEKANSIFCQSVFILLILSIFINVIAYIFSEKFCLLLGADDSLMVYAQTYLRWISIFGTFQMVGLGVSIFLRNDNAPNLAMVGTIVGAIANIILDYLFIMVFKWGIAGAAIATGIGETLAFIIYLTHFLSKKSQLKFKIPKLYKDDVLKIIWNGIPSFLMEFSQSTIALSFNLIIVAQLGVMGVTAYGVVTYIGSSINMVLIGLVQGSQPILSYNYGSGNNENVQKIYNIALKSTIVASIIFVISCALFGGSMISLFNITNMELFSLTKRMLMMYSFAYIFIGVTLMNILYFQTTEREGRSTIISILRCVGFVQLFLLFIPSLMGEYGIYLSFILGELCNCAVSIVLYFLSDKVALKHRYAN